MAHSVVMYRRSGNFACRIQTFASRTPVMCFALFKDAAQDAGIRARIGTPSFSSRSAGV